MQSRPFNSKVCPYEGTPPFLATDWADNAPLVDPTWCEWCAGTGHPYGDEAYGMCKCPRLKEYLASGGLYCAQPGNWIILIHDNNAHCLHLVRYYKTEEQARKYLDSVLSNSPESYLHIFLSQVKEEVNLVRKRMGLPQ